MLPVSPYLILNGKKGNNKSIEMLKMLWRRKKRHFIIYINSQKNIMKTLFKYFLTGMLVVTFGFLINENESHAQIQDQQEQPQGETVVDVVNSEEDHTHFAELLEETDMPKVLSQQGSFTVLVPSDDALESLDTDIEELKQNPQEAQELVSGHLYQGELPSEEVESALGVEVVDGDKKASNGVVHVIDEVVQR